MTPTPLPPVCPDGSIMEPADLAILLTSPFQPHPNKTSYGCVSPSRYSIPYVLDLLPPQSKYFAPQDLVDSLAALVIISAYLTVAIGVTKLAWDKMDSRFASISPSHKKWYVVANIYKAFLLSILASTPTYWLATWNLLMYDTPITDVDSIKMKRCALVYAVTDIVALYMVPKLPRTTVLHHLATGVVYITVGGLNMHQNSAEWAGAFGLCKMGVLYTLCSSFTYTVNACLGLRVVYPKATWIPHLVKISLIVYVVACAGNWSIQLYWFVHGLLNYHLSIFTILNGAILALVIRDDIILMGWLRSKSSSQTAKKID